MKAKGSTDYKLKDLEDNYAKVVYGSSWEVLPGFNGSPAYMEPSKALCEFWNDRKCFLRLVANEVQVRPTVIRVPINYTNKRHNQAKPYDHAVISCDDNVLICSRCQFPRLEHRRCLQCGFESLENPPSEREGKGHGIT